MKKTLLALTISGASLLTTVAHADVLGVYIGGHVWDNKAEGSFGEAASMATFDFEKEQTGSYFIAVEHPIPLIPNAKFSNTTIDSSGSVVLDNTFDFGGETFTVGSNTSATFDISYNDYTLYYEVFDNDLLTVDLGVTGRDFDGDVSATADVETTNGGSTTTQTLTGTTAVSQMVPMLYASTMLGLPFTGWNVFAEGNFLSFDDHTMYDIQAGVSYELIDNLAVDVNVTAGYRTMKLELEDLDDLYSDLEFDGVFAGLVIHF